MFPHATGEACQARTVYYNNKLVGIVSSGADTFITFNPPEDIQHLLNIQKGTLKALIGFKDKRKGSESLDN